MATMNLSVNANPSVGLVYVSDDVLSNSCKTVWKFKVIGVAVGETMKIEEISSLGSYSTWSNDPNYVFGSNYVTTTINEIYLEIENSGVPGQFNYLELLMTNVSTGATTGGVYTRFNDGSIC